MPVGGTAPKHSPQCAKDTYQLHQGSLAGSLPAIHRSLSAGDSTQSPSRQQHKQSGSGPKPPTPPLPPEVWSRSGDCDGSPSRICSGNGGGSSTSRSRSAGSPPAQGLCIAEYATASANALQAQVQLVQDAVGACQAAYAKARANVTNCMQRMQQLEQQVKGLQEEEKQLSAKVPLPVNRLCRVQQWLADRSAELSTERAALEGKQMALLKTESQLRARETEADLLAEAKGNLSSGAAHTAAVALCEAAAAHETEVAAANKRLKDMQTAAQQASDLEVTQQANAAQKIRAAEAGQKAAKKRLAGSQAAIKAHAAELAQAAAAEEQRRREALISLKERIDNVRESIGQRADRFRQLQKQKREQERREFEALQEQGLNPYEVYRLRDAEAAAAKAAAELTKKQAKRMADIAAVLAEEEKEYRKRLARQECLQQIEEQYQCEMGIAAQQQRIDAYMHSHTVTGQAVLDPTSRLHPYPSEAVIVKPAGFGLGRSSPEVVKKVARKHAGLQSDLHDSLHLPSKFREDMQVTSSDLDTDSLTAKNSASAENDTAAEDGLQAAAAANADELEAGSSEGSSEDDEEQKNSSRPGLGSSNSPGSTLTKRGPLPTVVLSKFETDRLQQRKDRHKASVAQQKTAFGRKFAGDAFIADPPEIVFKDFVPGQMYQATVQLINRSFTKNSVRLLEVPAEVVHVIDLDMPPSGCLAPGAAAILRVTFTPKVEADLSASIPLLAETGPLSLRLSCLARRALPSIDLSPEVCLNGRAGGVMLAATGKQTVTISNAGALAVAYDIKATGALASTTDYQEPDPPLPPPDATPADMAALTVKTNAATSLSVAGFTVKGIKGRVEGYGSLSFAVEFTPSVPGEVQVPLQVRFVAPENKALVLQPVQLTLTATGRGLPVSTLTPVVDFKCVMFGQTYAAELQLANAGKSVMKALVCSRPELNELAIFTPDFGFIQPAQTLSVSVCLKPTPEKLPQLAKFLLPAAATGSEAVGGAEAQGLQSIHEIPLQVTVPGQTMPVPFKLRFQPTTTELHLSPSTLDFGRVPMPESAGAYLSITNPSLLPQTFSFGAKLPLGLSISPGDGYGTVLPGETLSLLAKFQPPIPGLQYFGLTCRTLAGRVFKVQGKCEGLELDVTLSHNVIRFPATAVNDAISASVILKNSSSSTAHLFEFGVPDSSYIQVTPRVGCLKPNSSLRVQLDFAPPLALMEEDVATATASAVASISTGIRTSVEAPPPAAAPPPGAAAAGNSSKTATAAGAASGKAAPALGKAAAPTAQQRQHSAQVAVAAQQASTEEAATDSAHQHPSSNSSSSSSGGGGGSANSGGRWMWYRDWLLPCYIRPAAPGDESAIVAASLAAVAGLAAGSSSSDSSSSSSGSRSNVLHLAVTTCAVAPELQLMAPVLPKPPGKNYYVMDFGALPVGERCTRQLQLRNTGPDVAPLSSSPLDPEGIFAIVNALRPIEGFGGSATVLLAFSPQACKEYYEVLSIRSAKSLLRIALRGRGITPTISITPAAATSSTGGLLFNDVLLSDPVCKEMKVTVTNTCPFTISYSTRFIGAAPNAAGVGGAGVPAGAVAASAAAASQQRKPAAAGQAGSSPSTALPGAAAAGDAAIIVQQAAADSPSEPSGCFYCKPCGGCLEAGQSQELTVVLAPTGATGLGGLGPRSPYVADRLQIVVPYQQQDVVIPLQAGVWPDSVFVSGVQYSCSSTPAAGTAPAVLASCTVAGSSKTTAAKASLAADPFAAVVAAAAAAAATASSAAAVPAVAATGKGKPAGASTHVASSQQQSDTLAQQQQAELAPLPAALAAAGYCNLAEGTVTLPGPIAPGQTSSMILDFGVIKGSLAAAAGELVIEELPAAAKDAGWSVDTMKVSVPAGEKRPFNVRYTAPAAAKLQGSSNGALAELGLPIEQTVTLNCSVKGGCQPAAGAPGAGRMSVGADGMRRLKVLCTCVVVVPPVAQGAVAAEAAAAQTAGSAPAAATKAAAK